MKRAIVALLLTSLLLIGCGETKKISQNYGASNKMELVESKAFTRIQVDSVIVADSLAVFDKWHKSVLTDDDYGTKIEQRLFIKKCKDGSTMNYSTTYSELTNKKYMFKKIRYSKNEQR